MADRHPFPLGRRAGEAGAESAAGAAFARLFSGQTFRRGGAAPPGPETADHLRAFLGTLRRQTDRRFLIARTAAGLAILGYLAAALPAGGAGAVVALAVYLAAGAVAWAAGRRRPEATRWLFAGTDLAFFGMLRHRFDFQAAADPDATLAALYALLIVVYVYYSDPPLSLAVGGGSLAISAAGLAWGSAGTPPLRGLVVLGYLAVFAWTGHRLALRSRNRLLRYGSEAHERTTAALNTALERERRERLEELNRLKRSFIIVLSHELRTPLAPLRSSLEIARAEIGAGHEAHQVLGIALDASRKLERLVQDYTRLAELLTAVTEELAAWNLHLADVADLLSRELRGPRFEFRLPENLTVCANPRFLCGALRAILQRADLVTPAHLPVWITGWSRDGHTVLAVRDPVSVFRWDLDSPTDDVFSISTERTFASESSGLELTLARHFLQRTNGSLQIETAEEGGTTVYCELPAAHPEAGWLDGGGLLRALEEAAPRKLKVRGSQLEADQEKP